MTYIYAACVVCVTIFSTGGKFPTGFQILQLHAPTQATSSLHSWRYDWHDVWITAVQLPIMPASLTMLLRKLKAYKCGKLQNITSPRSNCWTFVEGRAPMHFIDVWTSDAPTKHVWAPPFTQVQRHSKARMSPALHTSPATQHYEHGDVIATASKRILQLFHVP